MIKFGADGEIGYRALLFLSGEAGPMAAIQEDETMTRIIEHRSALTFGAVVEMRIPDIDDAPLLRR